MQPNLAPKTTQLTNPSEIRVIAFPLANFWFALPITAIRKITLCPPEFGDDAPGSSLVYLDNQTITILNLSPYLAAVNQEQKSQTSNGKFLVIIKTTQEEPYGIRVNELPNMLDLPLAAIEKLPSSYRKNTMLGLASYVAVLPSQKRKLLLYLLDLEQALNLSAVNSTLRA